MALTYELDSGESARAAFGVVVLQSDETLEKEIAPLFQASGITLLHSRIPFHDAVTPEALRAMRLALPESVGLFPSQTPLDVIAYACTSGATMIGTDEVARAIRSVKPGAKVTDPVSAVVAACRALGVRRLGFLTPYMPPVSRAIQELLVSHGLEITAFGSFEQESDKAVARIAPRSVLEGIVGLGGGEVDAVFASCTNLRTFPIIAEAERRLGKPVISSNQALAWHMLSLGGVASGAGGPGMLFGGRVEA